MPLAGRTSTPAGQRERAKYQEQARTRDRERPVAPAAGAVFPPVRARAMLPPHLATAGARANPQHPDDTFAFASFSGCDGAQTTKPRPAGPPGPPLHTPLSLKPDTTFSRAYRRRRRRPLFLCSCACHDAPRPGIPSSLPSLPRQPPTRGRPAARHSLPGPCLQPGAVCACACAPCGHAHVRAARATALRARSRPARVCLCVRASARQPPAAARWLISADTIPWERDYSMGNGLSPPFATHSAHRCPETHYCCCRPDLI